MSVTGNWAVPVLWGKVESNISTGRLVGGCYQFGEVINTD